MSVPRATYRIQLTPDQDFAAVRELVPYLRDLGISHLYLSPSLTARSGSTHGYDVVDPTTVSAALGGEDGLRALADAGLGIVLDIVPNHMGVGDENRWWSDPEERVRVFDYDPEDGWYRRFFDIDDLAGVRVEDPDVFALTHDKVLELVRDGVVDGLRIDHPDGLADPAQYLRRLQDAGVAHVWVEKILSAQHPVEELPDWPVEGTVGYEFLGDATALFVDPAGEEILTDLFAELTGETRRFDEVALETQRVQATTTFSREVERLRTLHDVLGIADALAGIPVYRTYARPASGDGDDPLPSGPSSLSAADRDAIAASDAPEELQRVLRLEEPGHGDFVTKFQQTSPPVTAKGVEDTAFYRYVRLLALNEVGHEPDRFSLSVDAFHARNTARLEHTPHGLLSTQTHDTKRSGDVRARIGALAGMAGEVGGRGAPLACAHRRPPDGGRARRRRGAHDPPDARRRLAPDGRPSLRLPAEGDARGEGPHHVGGTRRGARVRRDRVRDRAARAPAVPRRLRAVRGARRRPGQAVRTLPDAAEAHRPGRSDVYQATSSRP